MDWKSELEKRAAEGRLHEIAPLLDEAELEVATAKTIRLEIARSGYRAKRWSR